MKKPARPLSLVAATAFAAVVGAATAGAAVTAPPYTTVAKIEALILNSDFATSSGITDADCVGLQQPKPKVNAQGQRTYHRFRCQVSGVYFDTTSVVVVFTGQGQFEVTGG
jgi:hypothetical protein